MIWHPRPGQRVTLRCRKEMRSVCPYLQAGVVEVAGKGPGPINALILLDGGQRVVVPRGNLFQRKEISQ